MLKVELTEVYGWEAAIRGMRNPLNSWGRSDTGWVADNEANVEKEAIDFDFESLNKKVIGQNDHNLMMRLAGAGAVHAKYRRMITVTCDITAPLYWWKEFDTYKVGTVANSCSTMHKIHAKEFTLDDFSCEHLSLINVDFLYDIIGRLNLARCNYMNDQDKDQWWQMIQLLPTSYNQKRTVQLNYEVLVGIYRDRKNHKLDEWHTLCNWIKDLPYSEIITGELCHT